MRKSVLALTMATFASVALFSCTSLKKMEKKVDKVNCTVVPEVLSVKGGEVPVEISAVFPGKYFNKKATVSAAPVLKFEKGEALYPSTALQGEKVVGNAKVVSKKEGAEVTYSGTLPFEDVMRISNLYVRYKATKGKKARTYDSPAIAKGVIATETLADKFGNPAAGGNNFQRITPDTAEAAIYYLINSANIRSSQSKSDEIAAVKEFAAKASAAEDMNLNNVEVRSYASPDGTQDWNATVANNRDKASGKFISKELNKKEIEEAKNADFFKQYIVAEDWDGFQKAMNASNIQDKELILRVLSMYSDPDVREREIKNISSAYTSVAEQILPKLRRSKFVVNAEKIGKSDEEILSLMNSDPSQLNVEEMLYAATLVKGSAAQLKVFSQAMKQFPKDWRAFNDYGVVKFNDGEVKAAGEYFKTASRINDNKIIANNKGCIDLINGNLKGAEALFGGSDCPEAKYNISIVYLLQGRYADASKSFGDCSCFNSCLASILAGDNSAAAKKLAASSDDVEYLKAVLAARNNDKSGVISNLKAAIAKDKSWKQAAATDMEFAAWFEDAEFSNIVK